MQLDRIGVFKEFLESAGRLVSIYEYGIIKLCCDRITKLQTQIGGSLANCVTIDIYGRIESDIDTLFAPYIRIGLLLSERE